MICFDFEHENRFLDPREKVSFFLNYLSGKNKENYQLGPNLYIDESMVVFKGRQLMKFYLSKTN